MEDDEDPLAFKESKLDLRAAESNHVPEELPSLSSAPAAPLEYQQNDCEGVSHQGEGAGDEDEEEVEFMDQDEIDFLEGAAQLGSLRTGKS